MRVLVMGTGGLGGYYGGVLARNGHDVTFVARGAHLDAIRQRGLALRQASSGETDVLHPAQAVATPDEAAGGADFDLILFTVKAYDTETAAAAIKPVVGKNTAVLTLQNGVDAVDQLAAAVGSEHVLAGTTRISTTLGEPGVICRTRRSVNWKWARFQVVSRRALRPSRTHSGRAASRCWSAITRCARCGTNSS